MEVKNLISFGKALDTIKTNPSLDKLAFQESILDDIDFKLVGIIQMGKNGNQVYFVSWKFQGLELEFLNKRFNGIKLPLIQNGITIDSYSKVKKEIKEFLEMLNPKVLLDYGFKKIEKEEPVDLNNITFSESPLEEYRATSETELKELDGAIIDSLVANKLDLLVAKKLKAKSQYIVSTGKAKLLISVGENPVDNVIFKMIDTDTKYDFVHFNSYDKANFKIEKLDLPFLSVIKEDIQNVTPFGSKKSAPVTFMILQTSFKGIAVITNAGIFYSKDAQEIYTSAHTKQITVKYKDYDSIFSLEYVNGVLNGKTTKLKGVELLDLESIKAIKGKNEEVYYINTEKGDYRRISYDGSSYSIEGETTPLIIYKDTKDKKYKVVIIDRKGFKWTPLEIEADSISQDFESIEWSKLSIHKKKGYYDSEKYKVVLAFKRKKDFDLYWFNKYISDPNKRFILIASNCKKADIAERFNKLELKEEQFTK